MVFEGCTYKTGEADNFLKCSALPSPAQIKDRRMWIAFKIQVLILELELAIGIYILEQMLQLCIVKPSQRQLAFLHFRERLLLWLAVYTVPMKQGCLNCDWSS